MSAADAGPRAPRDAPASKPARWFGREQMRRVVKATVLMLVVVGASWFATRLGLLPDLESVALDAQMRFNRPRENSPVAIVEITDSDYETIFGAKSPLDPAQVRRLLAAVAAERPSVIGVDLDTSDPSFAGFEIPPEWPTVVWGRVALAPGGAKLQPQAVLGGRSPTCSGIVAMQLDRDGVARHYRRAFPAEAFCGSQPCRRPEDANAPAGQRLCESDACPLPSFAWAVLQAHSVAGREYTPEKFEALRASAVETDELAVSFAAERRPPPGGRDDCAPAANAEDFQLSRRTRLTAGEIIGSAEDPQTPADFRPLEGKIVLVGGAYGSYSRDEHRTPLGMMAGVELLAQVLETELEGGGLPPPNWFILGALFVFDNLLLVLIFKRFKQRPVRTLALSVAAIFAVAYVCSVAAFRTPRFWAYFVPVLFLALVLELYDNAKDTRDESVRSLTGVKERAAPHLDVEPFAGTLGDYARAKVAWLAGEQRRAGHRDVYETWNDVRTELQPAALRVELHSKHDGRVVTREFYFFESVSGEKIVVETTGNVKGDS